MSARSLLGRSGVVLFWLMHDVLADHGFSVGGGRRRDAFHSICWFDDAFFGIHSPCPAGHGGADENGPDPLDLILLHSVYPYSVCHLYISTIVYGIQICDPRNDMSASSHAFVLYPPEIQLSVVLLLALVHHGDV